MNISDFSFFRNISELELEKIAVEARKINFAQGEAIISKGSQLNHIYFVKSGRVKESNCTRAGKEVVYNIFSKGDCFGLVWALNLEYSRAGFMATKDSDIYAVRINEFRQMMQRYPALSESVLSELSKVASKFSDKLYEMRALDVAERTRAELLRHITLDPGADSTDIATINNLPTHEEIANTIFTHREAVTREISRLIKCGVITKTDNNLLAANVPLLQKMVTEFG